MEFYDILNTEKKVRILNFQSKVRYTFINLWAKKDIDLEILWNFILANENLLFDDITTNANENLEFYTMLPEPKGI